MLSQGELNRLTRRYTLNIEHLLAPNRDIPAPDLGTNAQTMAWMMDAYGQLHGHSPAIVTGKPVDLGGSLGREAATGRGVSYILQEVTRDRGLNPSKTSIAVQGCGNVGSWTVRLLHEQGFRIVAVSDADGGVWNPKGLDIPGLVRDKMNGQSVAHYRGGEAISNGDLLERWCPLP